MEDKNSAVAHPQIVPDPEVPTFYWVHVSHGSSFDIPYLSVRRLSHP